MKDDIIYFNNAATSWPKPKKVIDLVVQSLKFPYHEHGRAVNEKFIDYPKLTRQKLCSFFNAKKSEHFQFTANATDSLNLLIHGYVMHCKNKIHVITSELEHNSVLRPLKTLEREKKIYLTIVPFNDQGYVSLSEIQTAIRDDTRLVVLNHGSNVLGTVQDIRTIGKYLAENEIYFIVDAAQTAGHIEIDLSNSYVDSLVFTGHKSLFGLPGIGGFYINDPCAVESYKQGGTGVLSQYLYHPEEMPLKYEFGTLNYPGIVSLYAGLSYIEEVGIKNIHNSTMKMTKYIIHELLKEENITIYNKNPDLPVIAFNIGDLDNDDVGYILMKEYNVVSRTGLHCAPLVHNKIDGGRGCVRLSLSFFNTLEECIRVVDAIRTIAQNREKIKFVT